MDKDSLVVIAPIVIAIGSGLTFIAYKHPREYRSFTILLITSILCLIFGFVIWNASNTTAQIAAIKSSYANAPGNIRVSDNIKRIDDLKEAIEEHSVPGWWPALLFVICFYLAFLMTFPSWLLVEAHQRQQSPRSDGNDVPDASAKEK